MVRIPNIDFIFLNNQEFTTKASDYEHGENNPSDTQQETLNPFDVYSDIYAQLNNGKTSELNNETFNKIMSGEIVSNDTLALDVIQAAMIDEDKENISQDELEELYNNIFGEVETTDDAIMQEYVNTQFESLTQLYLGKSAYECSVEEKNQAYALSMIESMLSNSQTELEKQDNLDGLISEAYDFKKELLNQGTCQADVEEALAQQEKIVNELKQAILNGNFEEKYLELTGVEFDINKIIEYQEVTYKGEILNSGITKATNFIMNVSLAGNMEDAFNLYIQYYGDKELAREKLNSFLYKMQMENNRPAIGYINENYEFITQNIDSEGNADESSTQVWTLKETVNWLGQDYNNYFQYMTEVDDFVTNFENIFGINAEEFTQSYITLSQETLGEADKVTAILNEYIQDQESFLKKEAQALQYLSMTLIAVGALTAFITPATPLGALGMGAVKAGQAIGIAGTFGDNIAEGVDLATNKNSIKEDKKYYKELLKETLAETTLFASGYIIGKYAGSISDELIEQGFSKLETIITEVGIDGTLSLLTDLVITGEIDLSNEGVSQLLSIITGLATAKLNNFELDVEYEPDYKTHENNVGYEPEYKADGNNIEPELSNTKFEIPEDILLQRAQELANMGVNSLAIMKFIELDEIQYQKALKLINEGISEYFAVDIAFLSPTQYDKVFKLIDKGVSEYNALRIINFEPTRYNKALELIDKGVDGGDIPKIINSDNPFMTEFQEHILNPDSSPQLQKEDISQIITLINDAPANRYSNIQEYLQAYEYFKNLTASNEATLATSKYTATDFFNYMLNINPCSINASDIEMMLQLMEEGTIGTHMLGGHLPTNGKINQAVVDDIVKLYEAYELGIKPIDMFVPTFKNATEAVMGGNDSVLFKGTYLDIKVGDVFQVEGEDFIRIKTSDTESTQLNISKETYFKLFPPVERYATTQNGIGNCWEVSGINTLLHDPDTRASVLKLFSEDGNDIVIKFPHDNLSEIRFQNGEMASDVNMKYFSNNAPGFQMIEYAEGKALQEIAITQAYKILNENIVNAANETERIAAKEELIKFSDLLKKHNNNIEITLDENGKLLYKEYTGKFGDAVYEYRNSGTQSDVYTIIGFDETERLCSNNPEEFQRAQDLLKDPESFKNYIIGWAAGGEGHEIATNEELDIYSNHAYRIKPGTIGPDGTIQTFKIVNPWGILEVELTYEELITYTKAIDISKKNL